MTADRLDALVTVTQRAVERQEVTFLATDADRDGGKIILVAGAPATSGDDEHRMLLAVREIMDAGAPLPIRIGVNRGSVFAGEVGPPYRRTFTVMGDAVNLAARLMAKAETGQVLSTPELLARSRTSFRDGRPRALLREREGPSGPGAGGRRVRGAPDGRSRARSAPARPGGRNAAVGRPGRLGRGRTGLGGGDRRRDRDGQVAAGLGAAPDCLGPDATDRRL